MHTYIGLKCTCFICDTNIKKSIFPEYDGLKADYPSEAYVFTKYDMTSVYDFWHFPFQTNLQVSMGALETSLSGVVVGKQLSI